MSKARGLITFVMMASIVAGRFPEEEPRENWNKTTPCLNESLHCLEWNLTSYLNASTNPRAEPIIGAMVAAVGSFCWLNPDLCLGVFNKGVKNYVENSASQQHSLGMVMLVLGTVLIFAVGQKHGI